MILVVAAALLAFMAMLMMMVRGCFCDCFGPCSREDPYDKPLDPEDVRKCLQKVRENQARREMGSEAQVFHPPPTAPSTQSNRSHVDSQQFQPVPQQNIPYRQPSPPPAYSETDQNPIRRH